MISAIALLAFLGLAWAGIAMSEGELRRELAPSQRWRSRADTYSRYARRPVAYKHYDIVISRSMLASSACVIAGGPRQGLLTAGEVG